MDRSFQQHLTLEQSLPLAVPAAEPDQVGRGPRRGLLAVLAAGLILASGGVGGALPAAAQSGEPRERLRREIELTDQILEEARAVVMASESARARNILPMAAELQETAHGFFARCGSDDLGACEGAARATVRARRQARQAIQIARAESGLDIEVTIAIERASTLVDEAAAAAAEQGGGGVERQLAEARTKLERAREQHRARQFRVALNLARAAERQARAAMGLGTVGPLRPERLAIELERTDRLIERAAPTIRDAQDERAGRELERAVTLQEEAHHHLTAGRPGAALRLTRQARDAVHGALRLVAAPVAREQVEQALTQTDQLIARIAEPVRASGQPDAIRLLDAAIEHERRARELLVQERPNLALAETRIARNLALEAEDLIELEGTGGG